MNFGLALAIGVLYWIFVNKIWYGTLHLVRQPMFLAVPIGLMMGDVPGAMQIGAALQLIYLGAIAPGGNLPTDEALASCIAIPIALAANLSPELSVTIAMPVGLIGVLADNLRRTYASGFVRMADNAAEEGDYKKLARATFWYPLWVAVPLRIIPVVLALMVGPEAVEQFLNSIPEWAINGLSIAGGLLPALGFAVTIIVIGNKKLIPFFFLGYIMLSYTGMNIIGISVVGICLALIQANFKPVDDDEGDESYV